MRKLVSKIAGTFLGLSLALGVGVVASKSGVSAVNAADTLFYTLTPANGSNNSYAGNCDIAVNGVTWNLTGNSQMQPWRIGGKNLSGVDRALYSKTALSDDVTKIEVTHGAASSVTVNSWTVIVSTEADGLGTVVSSLTPTFAANTTTTISRPSGKSWANCFYKFVYNVTIGGSNKFIAFSEAKFYKESGGSDPTFYTVDFDMQGHGTAPENQSIADGGKVTKPAAPTADGYTFGGWYKESDCLNAWNFSTDTVTTATTLYAKWTAAGDISGDYYAKVLSNDDLTAGQYLIVSAQDSVAFNGSLSTIDAGQNRFAVTITDNKIAADSSVEGKHFTLSVEDSAWTITSASGANVAHSGTGNGMNGTGTNSISITDGDATILGSGGKGLAYNSASGTTNERFRYYASPASGNNHFPSLFKFTEASDPTKKDMVIKQGGVAADGIELVYSSSSYAFKAFEESTELSDIAWSVSDQTVATISAAGALSCVKSGSVVVYAEKEGYNKASASITITKGSLSTVVVSGSMTKTDYYVGDEWSNDGLTVTANYSSGLNEDVTSSAVWSYNPASPALNVESVVATATFGGKSGSSSAQSVSVTRANPIQALYSKAKGASTGEFYGYYAGFATGSGPIVMDGAYGIMLYNSSQDVSSWTEGETILHISSGTIDIYNGLYEVKSYTVETVSSADVTKPIVHTTTGSESATDANRLTNATGVVAAAPTKGSFTGDPAASDIQFTYTVGSNTFTVYYKKAAQTSEVMAALADSLENHTEITLRGFTSWYNNFQLTMTGLVEAVESYTAEDFSQDLLDQTDAVCTGFKDGDNNHDALVEIWSDLASADKYPSLPTAQKTILAEAERNESGTVVEQAMARYDYLTGKYGLSNFINGRTPVVVAGSQLISTANMNNNSSTIVIVVVALTSITSIGVLLVIKRKRSLVK